MKEKPKPIMHKRTESSVGNYIFLCSKKGAHTYGRMRYKWKSVTCKNCLKQKPKPKEYMKKCDGCHREGYGIRTKRVQRGEKLLDLCQVCIEVLK